MRREGFEGVDGARLKRLRRGRGAACVLEEGRRSIVGSFFSGGVLSGGFLSRGHGLWTEKRQPSAFICWSRLGWITCTMWTWQS